MSINEMLGIDIADPIEALAQEQRQDDRAMFRKLRRLRERRRLTQQQVADRMEVDQSTVARIESGRRDVHLSTLRLYALAVHAHIDHRVVDVHSPITELPLPTEFAEAGSNVDQAMRLILDGGPVQASHSTQYVWVSEVTESVQRHMRVERVGPRG